MYRYMADIFLRQLHVGKEERQGKDKKYVELNSGQKKGNVLPFHGKS